MDGDKREPSFAVLDSLGGEVIYVSLDNMANLLPVRTGFGTGG